MQEEANLVVDAALAQFAGERQQMVIMDPQNIVFFDQRQQLVRQQRVDFLIAIPGFALEIDQIKTVVESGPQHRV